jgi:hypothetical protein
MRSRAVALATALAAATACPGHDPGPRSLTPSVGQAAGEWEYGHWVILKLDGGRKIGGELIAVDDAAGLLYLGWGATLTSVPLARVREIDVVEHSREGVGDFAWSWSGLATTPSHGVLLLVTAPIWLFFGVVPAGKNGTLGVERASLGELRAWARFPQGLPGALVGVAQPLEDAR